MDYTNYDSDIDDVDGFQSDDDSELDDDEFAIIGLVRSVLPDEEDEVEPANAAATTTTAITTSSTTATSTTTTTTATTNATATETQLEEPIVWSPNNLVRLQQEFPPPM